MFNTVDSAAALARTITDATSREPVVTRIEFAPGHEDVRLTDDAIAAKLRLMKAAGQLRDALVAARALIWTDRQSLSDTHMDPVTNEVDEDGAEGVAEYDAVLAQIDAALAEAGTTSQGARQ